MMIPFLLSVCACLNALAAASRQAWALGRDQVLPFSPWFRKVYCLISHHLSSTANTTPDRSDWNSRPHQQHPLLPLRPRNHRIDQHRLDRSPQHYCRPPHRRHKLQLRPEHRLYPVEAPAQRASTACSLLTWEFRTCDQCICDSLCDRLSDGFVLPCCYSDGCGEHELVVGNVWRSGGHCLCGLWGEGQEALH
jgi:hypothetical protein